MRAMNPLIHIMLMLEDWKIIKNVKSLISWIYFNLETCVGKMQL